MTNDCFDWELESTIFEVSWWAAGVQHQVFVHTEEADYALDRAWEYCQNHKSICPDRKEDLVLSDKVLLF